MRLDSAVIGMDFSRPAIRASHWAAEVFAPRAALTLVHVIDPPELPRYAAMLVPSLTDVEGHMHEYAERELEHVSMSLARRPRTEIRVGKPYEELVHAATELDASLIVLGPHGERRRRPGLLGTTVDRIARTAHTPVLVATAPPAGAPRRILVPVCDDAVLPALLRTARDLAAAFDATVTLLHVWSNAVYSHVASMVYATARSEERAEVDMTKELREAAHRWLDELTTTGIAPGHARARLAYGNAGDATLEVAATDQSDLILVGRRHPGNVVASLLGSTITTVLHGATCPVLIIPESPQGQP